MSSFANLSVPFDTDFSALLSAPAEASFANSGFDAYGIMRARGADAAAFLHAQLTNDVLLLQPQQARLAAWCSAKGRMLASMIVLKISGEELLLIMSRDLLATTLKRLRMFVLRAKCELSDATAQYQLIGHTGAKAASMQAQFALENVAVGADFMPAACQIDAQNQVMAVLALPPVQAAHGRVQRLLQLCPLSEAPGACHDWNADLAARWQWLEVASGIARLSAPVSETFVPQMLNYESIGGVSFKKGCYPGQEVVARSQFRGAIKRRGGLASCDAALSAGQEVYDEREPQQLCGMVAQAASHAGQHAAIVSLQTSAADSPGLRLGHAQGAKLQLHALPYALREDI